MAKRLRCHAGVATGVHKHPQVSAEPHAPLILSRPASCGCHAGDLPSRSSHEPIFPCSGLKPSLLLRAAQGNGSGRRPSLRPKRHDHPSKVRAPKALFLNSPPPLLLVSLCISISVFMFLYVSTGAPAQPLCSISPPLSSVVAHGPPATV